MNSLQFLPVELIEKIFSELTKTDLLSVRHTDKHLSSIATRFAFSSITVIYTEASFEKLLKISQSGHLACHVESFEYCFRGVYYGANCRPFSSAYFGSRILPPRSQNELLGEFYTRYIEQYECHKRISTSRKDHQALCSALQQFHKLKSVSLRRATPEQYPYCEESWPLLARDEKLGGERAHQTIAHALRSRYGQCCGISPELARASDQPRQPFTEISFYSATERSPTFVYGQTQRTVLSRLIGFDPLDTSSHGGLENLTTLNLDLRPRGRSLPQADQIRKNYSEQVARSLSALNHLRNLCLGILRVGYREGVFFPGNPLRGTWKSLRVVILSGWEFTEEDILDFVQQQAPALRSFFVDDFSLIVQEEEEADEVFFRVWEKLRNMQMECLLDAPFYYGVRIGDSVVHNAGEGKCIPIDMNEHLAEGLRERRRRLYWLFERP